MALTLDQFLDYAREQIRTAEGLLADHVPAGTVSCGCARPLPCPQARSLAATLEHYQRKIAWLERTQLLPVVASPAAPPRPRCRRRAVLAWLARPWRRSPHRGDL